MSVVRSKRKQSGLQFIDIAHDLQVFTLKACLRIEKRYTFFISTGISNLSYSIYNNVKSANSIFPTNQHEAQIRRDYLIRANCDLQALFSQVDILYSMNPEKITDNMFEEWIDLIELEAKLISGAKDSDKKRYSTLK